MSDVLHRRIDACDLSSDLTTVHRPHPLVLAPIQLLPHNFVRLIYRSIRQFLAMHAINCNTQLSGNISNGFYTRFDEKKSKSAMRKTPKNSRDDPESPRADPRSGLP